MIFCIYMFFLYIQYYMHFYEIWCFLKSRYIWNRKKSGDIPCIYVKRYLLYLCIYLFGMIWSVWGEGYTWQQHLEWCAIRCGDMKSSAVGWWLGRHRGWRLVKRSSGLVVDSNVKVCWLVSLGWLVCYRSWDGLGVIKNNYYLVLVLWWKD